MIEEIGKMTITFNRKTYGTLLAEYQPKVITTEVENEQAIALAQELEHRSDLTSEEETFLELLVALIEKFENENYPIPQSNPHVTLRYLMQENNLKEEDLINIFGSKILFIEVINGHRNINQIEAQSLAKFFNVDVELFS